jgi:hypothetical protein
MRNLVILLKGKRGSPGEIRTWGGKRYQKTPDGWKLASSIHPSGYKKTQPKGSAKKMYYAIKEPEPKSSGNMSYPVKDNSDTEPRDRLELNNATLRAIMHDQEVDDEFPVSNDAEAQEAIEQVRDWLQDMEPEEQADWINLYLAPEFQKKYVKK